MLAAQAADHLVELVVPGAEPTLRLALLGLCKDLEAERLELDDVVALRRGLDRGGLVFVGAGFSEIDRCFGFERRLVFARRRRHLVTPWLPFAIVFQEIPERQSVGLCRALGLVLEFMIRP